MDLLLAPPRRSEAVIARLRESDPVAWIPGVDVWFVTRNDDVRLQFANNLILQVLQLIGPPFGEDIELVLTGALEDGTLVAARDCIRTGPSVKFIPQVPW